MGVKSLSRYLNQYKAASETAKDIANRLINLEERLVVDLRAYLYPPYIDIFLNNAKTSRSF